MANTIVLRLNSPYGGEPAQFNLLDQHIPDESNELIQTIRHLSEDHAALKEILADYLRLANRQSQFEDGIRRLCERFNEWCETFKTTTSAAQQPNQRHQQQGSTNQIRFIMQLIYNRAVLDPDKLNQYEPFSPQVYGETSFDLIDQMLKKVNLNENDVFLDLGSGVGNVVLHVAAVTRCKRCYGFEKAEWPALYATRMEKEFKFWMNFFGKTYSDFRLYKADFLSEEEYLDVDVEPPSGSTSSSSSTNVNVDQKVDSTPTGNNLRHLTMSDFVKEVINQSNLIFVNNYAFGAELDHQLKMRFLEMLEGSIIVSSKPFCPLNFRINDRNLNDIGAILNLTEFEPLIGPVSWTDRPINYYFQKIDHTLLEKYFESKKFPQKTKSERGSGEDRDHQTGATKSASSSPSTSISSSPTSPTSDHNSSSLSSASGSSVGSSGSKSKRTKTVKPVGTTAKAGRKRKSSDFDTNGQTAALDLNSSTSDVDNASGKLKRAKLSEKKPVRGKAAAVAAAKKRSKSLDKQEKKTLEKMHESVSKIANGKMSSVQKKLASNSSGNFNAKSMTKLSTDNLDSKSLRESKISAKFLNKPSTPNKLHANKNGNVNSGKMNGNSVVNGNRSSINGATNGLVDPDEVNARRELGDDVINAIDNYLKKCRKQYISYLMYMKSCEYRNKSLMELQAENSLKKEMLIKKDLLEIQASNLVKANINLIRMRAAEIGIKDLKSPLEIIQQAKEVLSSHRELESRLKTANQGQQHPALMNGHSEANIIGRLIDSIESSRKSPKSPNGVSKPAAAPAVDEEDGEIVETLTTNPNRKPTTTAHATAAKNLDEYLSGVKGGPCEDTLRNFKIPKQAKVEPSPALIDSCDSPTNHLINDSSCSNSPSFNMTNNLTLNHHHNSHHHHNSSKYYHPKKNQFRQYMMENQTTTND